MRTGIMFSCGHIHKGLFSRNFVFTRLIDFFRNLKISEISKILNITESAVSINGGAKMYQLAGG